MTSRHFTSSLQGSVPLGAITTHPSYTYTHVPTCRAYIYIYINHKHPRPYYTYKYVPTRTVYQRMCILISHAYTFRPKRIYAVIGIAHSQQASSWTVHSSGAQAISPPPPCPAVRPTGVLGLTHAHFRLTGYIVTQETSYVH